MVIYFFLFLIWSVAFDFFTKRVNDGNKYFSIFVGVTMFIILGFKDYSVGSDTLRYLYRYENNPDLFSGYEYYKQEVGFTFVIFILNGINASFQEFYLIYSLFISYVFSRFYYNFSKNTLLSFFLHVTIGIFAMTMSGMRQSITICLFLLAFEFAIKKRVLLYFFIIGIATTFHTSSVFLFPMYFIINFIKIKKYNGKNYVTILLISSLSLLFIRELFVPVFEFLMPKDYEGTYELLSKENPINPLVVATFIAVPIASLVVWEPRTQSDKEYELYFIFFVFSILASVFTIFSLNSNILGRLSFYFIPFNMILIANVISDIQDKKVKLLFFLVGIILPLIQFLMATPGGILKIDNYRFIW